MKEPPISKSKFEAVYLKSHGNNSILRKRIAAKRRFINQLLQHITIIALRADITVLGEKLFQETIEIQSLI